LLSACIVMLRADALVFCLIALLNLSGSVDSGVWLLGQSSFSCEETCVDRSGSCSAESILKQNAINASNLITVSTDIGTLIDMDVAERSDQVPYAPYYKLLLSTGKDNVFANNATTSDCYSSFECSADYVCGRLCFCTFATTTTTTAIPFAAELKSERGAFHFLSLRVDGTVVVMKDVRDIAAGSFHSLFLMTDGRVYAAGRNQFGQLGDHCFCTPGMPECHRCQDGRPPQAWPILMQEGVAAIAAGDGHSVILRDDGDVYTVGWNTRGQLGDNTVTSRRIPVLVERSVISISAGAAHTLLLKTDGTAHACGANGYGQLGDGTLMDQASILNVQTGIARIWAGVTHSLFYRFNGTVHVTGVNSPFVGPS